MRRQYAHNFCYLYLVAFVLVGGYHLLAILIALHLNHNRFSIMVLTFDDGEDRLRKLRNSMDFRSHVFVPLEMLARTDFLE